MPLMVTYRNSEGAMRRLAVPEVEGVEPERMLAGVVKQAIADSGPIATVRLIADADAAGVEPEAASVPAAEESINGKPGRS